MLGDHRRMAVMYPSVTRGPIDISAGTMRDSSLTGPI